LAVTLVIGGWCREGVTERLMSWLSKLGIWF